MKRKYIYLLILIIVALAIYFFTNQDETWQPNSKEMVTILEINNTNVTIAPEDYDGDEAERFKDKIISYSVAEDLVITSESVTITIDNDGKEHKKNHKEKTTINEMRKKIEGSGSLSGYISLDKDDKVCKINLYGETTIWK